MKDQELLKKYEPTLHFTAGELFYPCAVDGYLAQCTLWRGDHLVLRKGEINTNVLGRYESTPDKADYHLRFVEKPLSNTEAARWRLDPKLPQFKAGGRLSRVGLASRLIDNLLDISLLIRGNVPAGTAASAELQYRDLIKEDERDVYYGRVVREGGYIILHYLFFYVMNNWRTGFYGVNDHEADWEQIFVYLEETDSDPIPRWVAYASHDFKGDDLRRRWDDPELERDGNHPIVYVGAGSHASYFQQGEYLMSVEPSFVRPVSRLLRGIQTTWRKRLGMGAEIDDAIEGVRNLIRVPFVDYARGDGESIGANSTRQWFPIEITETDEWVHAYRGLWGLDTQDFVGGERAPAGAKFQRDGSVRQSWADPLGWAGLDKVPPLNERKERVQGMILGLETTAQELEQQISSTRHRVRDLAIEVDALAMIEPNSELYARQAGRFAGRASGFAGVTAGADRAF